MKRLIILLFFLSSIRLSAQTSIGGICNEYYSVSAVGAQTVTCTGEDLSNLQVGNKVMLYQVKGAKIFTTGSFPEVNGVTDSYFGSGSFEFLAVNSVNNSTKEISFTSYIKRTYNPDQKVQIIKIFEDEVVTVDSLLTAASWDSTTGKGGIVAIVALKKLILNADIDVSGKGFVGAQPEPYSAGCRQSYATDTFYFVSTAANKAGLKGEGIMEANFSYTKGPGHNFNGGGGGRGLFAGGAGGGLFKGGGIGDVEEESCGSGNSAYGGIALGNPFFTRIGVETDPDELWPAVTFGGGGGASTDDGSSFSTPGGNGGGIVIILTDTLIGNGHSIRSNGEDVTGNATGGAGGGGAGGVVVLDAESIITTLGVSVKGGYGGSVSDVTGNCGGSGGGGAGGLYWHNYSTKPANVLDTLSPGDWGSGSCNHISSKGDTGIVLNNYQAYLNGFNFNAISGDDTVCNGQTPNEIIGSIPKGVLSPAYQWLESSDGTNWVIVSDSVRKDFMPPSLSSSKYFTRVVTNDDGYSDTAISVFIQVWPKITNNELTLRDTTCFGIVPGELTATIPSGGDGSNYDYIWESAQDLDTPIWGQKGTDVNLNETEALIQNTFYRRIVIAAGVCSDTSKVDTLSVLPAITNNSILSAIDTTICAGLDAGVARGSSPSGGDGMFWYEWIESIDGDNFSAIPGSNSPNYNKAVLFAPTYYQRVVYSGSDSACKDTTSNHFVDVLPPLQDFDVFSDSAKYCYNETPFEIRTNPLLSGGDGTNYVYQWMVLNGSVWEIIDGETKSNYFPPALTQTTSYKRSVLSGEDDACIDTSNVFEIKIVPQILNNTLLSDPSNICEGDIPEPFIENPANGGVGGITYQWQIKKGINPWTNAGGESTGISYASGLLTDSVLFQRLAISDICKDTSNHIVVPVFPSIMNNTITGSSGCYNSRNSIKGSDLFGGSGAYSYTWLLSTDGVSWNVIPDAEESNYTTEKITDETYYKRVAYSGEALECVDTSEALLLTLNPLPTLSLVSKRDTLCQRENIEIEYFNLTGVPNWTLDIGTKDFVYNRTVLATNDPGTIIFELNETANIRILSLEDGNGCFADTSLDDSRVDAFVFSLPKASAGDSQQVCGNQTILEAQVSVENSYGTWFIDNGTVEPEGSPTGILTVQEYGEYNIIWRESTSKDCYTEDELYVVFYEQPTQINAGSDIEEDYTFVHQLEADQTDVGKGSWTQIAGEGKVTFDDSTLYNAVVTLPLIGSYTLKWVIKNGVCTPITDELVIDNHQQTIRHGFSPNSDGINDEYIIKLKEGNDGELIILDVNGTVVNRLKSVGNVILWDGKSDSNSELPDGTYYFILREFGETTLLSKGFIELRR